MSMQINNHCLSRIKMLKKVAMYLRLSRYLMESIACTSRKNLLHDFPPIKSAFINSKCSIEQIQSIKSDTWSLHSWDAHNHQTNNMIKNTKWQIGNSKAIWGRNYAYVDGEGGPIRRLCCHPCWVKTSLATRSNRIHTALNSDWYSVRCSVDHIRSQCVQR